MLYTGRAVSNVWRDCQAFLGSDSSTYDDEGGQIPQYGRTKSTLEEQVWTL